PKELIEGVNKMLEAGASKQLVEEFLLERGWSEEDAKAVFREIEKEAETKKREAAPLRAPLPKEVRAPRKEERESETRVIQAPPRALAVQKKEEPVQEHKESAPRVKPEERLRASSHAPAPVRREKTEKREEVKKEALQ